MAVRSPGSRSVGLLVPVESFRDVVLLFVLERSVLFEFVDTNGFVSVEDPGDVDLVLS